MNALRRQTQMPNHGNLRLAQRAHKLDARTLNLHRLGAGLFHKPDSVGHAFATVP
jgi:hypothetical protein